MAIGFYKFGHITYEDLFQQKGQHKTAMKFKLSYLGGVYILKRKVWVGSTTLLTDSRTNQVHLKIGVVDDD